MTLPLRRADRLLGDPPVPRPDFVDLEQMTSRLATTTAAIARLRKRRRFPEPDRHFRTQELWWWPHVALWARQRGGSIRQERPRDVVPVVDLVGLSEIAQRLGVPVKVLQYWLGSGRFPAPDYRWSTTSAWIWESVEAWTGSQNRRRFETPLWSRLVADVREARLLVAEGRPTARLRKLLDEVAAEEKSVLGTSRLAMKRELSDAEFLAKFDAIRDRLDEIADVLAAVETSESQRG